MDVLVKKGLVKQSDAKKFGVKILGRGKLEKKLEVQLPLSKSAGDSIIKAGGKHV